VLVKANIARHPREYACFGRSNEFNSEKNSNTARESHARGSEIARQAIQTLEIFLETNVRRVMLIAD
jgi:hypothetical protein